MKVPYPNMNSNLAIQAHMYICRTADFNNYKFIKCQTLKPYMLYSNPINNYHDEYPDENRNPFTRPTRIDCDKIFNSINVSYSDNLLATTRRDINNDLFNILLEKIDSQLPKNIFLDRINLARLNRDINLI